MEVASSSPPRQFVMCLSHESDKSSNNRFQYLSQRAYTQQLINGKQLNFAAGIVYGTIFNPLNAKPFAGGMLPLMLDLRCFSGMLFNLLVEDMAQTEIPNSSSCYWCITCIYHQMKFLEDGDVRIA